MVSLCLFYHCVRSNTIDEIRAEYYEDDSLPDLRGTWLPAQLDVPATIGMEKPEEQTSTPEPEAAPPVQLILNTESSEHSEPEEPEEPEPAAMRADLAAWRRKSLHSLKAGKGAAVVFESNTIPPDTHADIWAQLQACKTASDVREVFEQAMAGGEVLPLAAQVKALTELVNKSAWVMYP